MVFTLSLIYLETVLNQLGLYSSQESIKISCLWTRSLFELGLYSSQASIKDSTVILQNYTVSSIYRILF